MKKRTAYITLALALSVALSFAGIGVTATAWNLNLPGKTAGTEGQIAAGGAVQYERVVCFDEALNCEAARSIAPAGWQVGGEAVWNLQSYEYPAMVNFFVQPPGGEALVGYVTPRVFQQPDQYEQWSEGEWTSGTCPSRAYEDAQNHAYRFIGEYMNASNVQYIETQPLSADEQSEMQKWKARHEQMLEENYAPIRAMTESMGIGVSSTTETYVDGAAVVALFDMDGIRYKAYCKTAMYADVMTFMSDYGMFGTDTTQRIFWGPIGGYCIYIAEEEVYDKYWAGTEVFWSNLIINQQWAGAIRQASDKLFSDHQQRTYETIMQQQKNFQQTSAQYVAQSERNYSYSSGGSGYSSRVMDGWRNAVVGEEYFETSDGGYTKLDSSYMHTYSDGSGFIQSNDPMDLPSGWNEVSGSTMLP